MTFNRFRKTQSSLTRKGSVLILVMVAVTVGAVLLMQTQFSSRQRMVAADSHLLRFKMEQALLDALLEACRTLASDEDLLVDTLEEPWAEPLERVDPNGISVRTRIADAQRYFDINNVIQESQPVEIRPVADIIHDLFNQCGDFAAGQRIQAMEDWIDSNHNGFYESDLYEKMDVPYMTENRPFSDWSEWLSVEGFSLAYFGEDYRLRPRDPKDFKHIPLDTFTVLPLEHRQPMKVNINTAGRQVLIGILGVAQTTLVESIINARKIRPFRDTTALASLVDPALIPTFAQYIDTKSNYFILQTQAYHQGHTARSRALVHRKASGEVEVLQWVM